MDTIQKTTNKILIKELLSMKVASYRIISANPERDAVNYMKNLLKYRMLNINNLRRFGIYIPVSETQQNIGLRGYEYWFCLPDDTKKLEGATIKNVPISNYAVLRIKKILKDHSIQFQMAGWNCMIG
jgi:AraC family transcriptional regulator